MKTLKVILVLLVAFGMKAQEAKSLNVNLYGGYNFDDKIYLDYGSVVTEDSFQYGIGVEYFPTENKSVELKYLRTNTAMPAYTSGGKMINPDNYMGAMNYLLIGGNHYFKISNQPLLPYIGGSLGLGLLESPQSGNDRNFAWDIRGGVKIKTESIVSVNLQASLQSMIANAGGDVFYSWYGPVVVSEYVGMYQVNLGAVISFAFKK